MYIYYKCTRKFEALKLTIEPVLWGVPKSPLQSVDIRNTKLIAKHHDGTYR